MGTGKRIIKPIIKPIVKPIVVETKLARKAKLTLEKYKARPVETLTSSSGGSRAREQTLKKLLSDRSKLPPEIGDALEAELKRVQKYIVEKWHGKIVPLGKTAPIIPKPKIKVPKKVKPKPTPEQKLRGKIDFAKGRWDKPLDDVLDDVGQQIDDAVFGKGKDTIRTDLSDQIEKLQLESEKIHEKLRRIFNKGGSVREEGILGRASDRIQADLRAVRKDMSRHLKRTMREGLGAQKPLTFKYSIDQSIPGFLRDGELAVKYVKSVVDDRVMSAKKMLFYNKKSGRAFYTSHNTTCYLDGYAQKKVFVHETAHWLEDHSRHLHKRAIEFLKMRTKGEKIRVIVKGKTRALDEWGWKDKFKEKYSGKKYTVLNGDRYSKFEEFTDQIPNYQINATEIVSMGLQQLYSSPLDFWRTDREYFRFIVGVLNGWI